MSDDEDRPADSKENNLGVNISDDNIEKSDTDNSGSLISGSRIHLTIDTTDYSLDSPFSRDGDEGNVEFSSLEYGISKSSAIITTRKTVSFSRSSPEIIKHKENTQTARTGRKNGSVPQTLPVIAGKDVLAASNLNSHVVPNAKTLFDVVKQAGTLKDRPQQFLPLFPGRRPGARGNRGSTGIFNTRDPPTEEEVKFLEAAEYGNIPTVRRMLEESTTFSVNCVDYMGQNALQLAVGNEHLEVVEVLLKQPVMARIGDALLLAISKGYVRIAEIILNHPSFQVHDRLTRSPCEQRLMNQGVIKRNSLARGNAGTQTDSKSLSEDTDFYAYDEDGTRFSPDITPIILAAQCQEYEIVHELLMRGARIERPHNYRCTCEECLFRKKLDSFSYSLSRINAYKGLASPAYLSLSSSDPVLTALELSHELQLLAEIEKEFKKDYQDLAAQCNNFTEKLLDLCHDTEEVEIILNGEDESTCKEAWGNNKTKKAASRDRLSKETPSSITSPTDHQTVPTTYSNNNFTYQNSLAYPSQSMPQLKRLRTAIKYSVKGFVAHPNCQQQLLRLWQRNLSWLWQSPAYFKWFFSIGVSFFMPFLALIYVFAPCTKAGILIKSPFCKFTSHAMSYFQFLLLLVINSSDRFEGDLVPSWFFVHQDNPNGRYTTFTWCEIVIMLYVIGFLWTECHEVFDEGPREYMFKLWNIIDFLMLSIFFSSYALRAISYYRVRTAQGWWDENFKENATLIFYDAANKTYYFGKAILNQSIPDEIGYYAYRNAERKYWHGADPQLLSESLFSFAIVLSFSRIAYILPANELFGPLQISLGRTVIDILKWLILFFMIFGAFLLGLFNLYSYYAIPGAKSNKSFTTLEETFITLFWSMFGLADYKGVEVNYSHPFTRLVGYQLYGAYNIIMVIVMLNMLIAMINSSYSQVETDADLEWKFARAKLWLSYFDDGSTLPVPYNIIPSPKSVQALFRKISGSCRKLCRCCNEGRRNESNCSESQNTRKRKFRSLRETVSMSSFGAHSGGKQNGLRRTETVANTFQQWRGLSAKRKNEQLTRYQVIMRRIVKRFVIRAQAEKDRDEVNEGELQEIKHDISSLRFELLENNASYAEEISKIRSLLEKSNDSGSSDPGSLEAIYDQPEEQIPTSSESAQRKKILPKSSSAGDINSPKLNRKPKTMHSLWSKARSVSSNVESPVSPDEGIKSLSKSPTAFDRVLHVPEEGLRRLSPPGTENWQYADAAPYDETRTRIAASLSTIREKDDDRSSGGLRRQRRSAYVDANPLLRRPSPRHSHMDNN